jgi:hypothetical protein
MATVTYDARTSDSLRYEHVLRVDGKPIGFWHVSKVLQDQYGEFWPNDYGKQLLGKECYCAGPVYIVAARLGQRIAARTAAGPRDGRGGA